MSRIPISQTDELIDPCCLFGLDPRTLPEDDMLALYEARAMQKKSQSQEKSRPDGSARYRQDLVAWRSHHRYLFTRRGEVVANGSVHRWSLDRLFH